MSGLYWVTHHNGRFSRPPLLIKATKASMAAKKFLDGVDFGGPRNTSPVRLRKGEFITISIERKE